MLKGAGGLNFWELFEEFIADELKGQKVCFSCRVAAIPEDVVSKWVLTGLRFRNYQCIPYNSQMDFFKSSLLSCLQNFIMEFPLPCIVSITLEVSVPPLNLLFFPLY